MTVYAIVSDVAPVGLYLLDPEESPIGVGRDAKCAVFLPEASVSRRHAQFRWEDERFLLEDLGSANGTQINAEPLGPASPVHPNDVIEFGPFAFRYRSFVSVEQALDEVSSEWPIPLVRADAGTEDGFQTFQGSDLLAIAYRLHYGKRWGALRVRSRDGGDQGSLEFIGGHFGGARFGDQEGLEAAKALFRLAVGRFRFELREPEEGRTPLLRGGELLLQIQLDQAGPESAGKTRVQTQER